LENSSWIPIEILASLTCVQTHGNTLRVQGLMHVIHVSFSNSNLDLNACARITLGMGIPPTTCPVKRMYERSICSIAACAIGSSIWWTTIRETSTHLLPFGSQWRLERIDASVNEKTQCTVWFIVNRSVIPNLQAAQN
jgi:hypothetical protein